MQMDILLSPTIKAIKDADFINELQYQLNSFWADNDGGATHCYLSEFKPIAIEISIYDPNTIIIEDITSDWEKIRNLKNGGRY